MSTSLATKHVATILVSAAVVFGLAFAFAKPAKADTLSDLQAQVQALLAQIASLQGSTSGSTSGSMTSGCTTFTQNLKVGATGGEVMAVQKFLNGHGFVIAATGAGSPGNETSYFGPATKAAVIKFQNANAASILTPVGLTAGTGNWFASTRAAANASCAGGSTGTGTGTTPTGPGITVTAGAQPANSLAPVNASRVPFTTFTLTNNTGAAVTINGITVQRTGLAQDAAFSGVVLVDSTGQQLGIARVFNANHQATVGDTFTLQPGASMTYTVAGNMETTAGGYAGQVASISVIGVNTSVPVNGSLPISGAQQTINETLSIGTVTANTSSFDPNAAQTKNIGDTAVKFAAVRLTAGSAEDVKLFSIRFRMNGSASASDLSNMAIVVSGTTYPATWSVDGRYVSASIPGGALISKGSSVDAYIQGDITGSNSSGRVAEFDVDKATDIYTVGQLYGYGIVPTGPGGTLSTASTHASTFSSSQPFFQGSTITIQGGTGTSIQNATSVAAQNIAVNVPNQPLGGFTTNFAGEPVTVQNLVVSVATTSGATRLTNVTIVDKNGNVVAGPVDEPTSATNGSTLTFSGSITFPVGSMTYTLKGTVSSGATNGSTYRLSTTPSSQWTNVTGQTTGNTISLSGFSSAVTMNLMTVQGLSLAISASSNPASQNIVAGGQSVLFANIQLDASASGEDVRLNSLKIDLVTGGASNVANLTGCQLFDTNGNALNYGSNIVNSVASTSVFTGGSSNTFSFNNSLTVSKGTVATLPLKCNVASGAAGTYQFGVDSGDSITVSGATSGNSTTVNPVAGGSGTMTVGSSSLTLNVDPSSPNFALVAGNTTGVTVGVYKFHPTSEAMTLTKLGVTLSASSTGDVSKVYFYSASGTQLGTAIFAGSNTATSTLQTTLALPADTDTLVTVKADVSDIGTGQPGTEGSLIKVSPVSAEATGQSSGSVIMTGSTDTVAGARAYNTFPTIAQDTLSSTGMADGNLLRFKVTADSHGNVGIDQFSFSISTTSPATVSAVKLYGYSDSSYTTPISSGADSQGQIGSTYAPASNSPSFAISPTTNPVEVPAGQTYYFALKGTVVGGTNAAVVTTLVGGDTYAGVGNTTYLSASKFIWSPNATTTVPLAGNDWTNGYGVTGLGTGFSQARSN